MDIRIYFEGNRLLKAGFKRFFADLSETARQAGHRLRLIAAKSGPRGYEKALREHRTDWNILLKDSEAPLPTDPKTHCTNFGLDASHANNVFWMVELMESWFLAHPEVVENYYGLSEGSLGHTQNVEKISKTEVLSRLKKATRKTTKREYDKVKHAPFLLERLDPNIVQSRAPNCRSLFDTIKRKF